MFRNWKYLVGVLATVAVLAVPNVSSARENVTDWYIRDFDSQIIVNKDSSLDITETIVADCGMAVGKHGIFRILPTRLSIDGKKVETPVTLGSITDENGTPYAYQTIENASDGTVTWKIGAADTTVQGAHTYVISYSVKNAIRFGNAEYDELYWNLNGNFWDLETDAFHASIRFPKEVTDSNTKIDYYTGLTGSKDKTGATYAWMAPSVLEFRSTSMLPMREGITASVTFPKGIFTRYVPGFWETNGKYFFFLIPFFTFLGGLSLWRKYGDDPDVNRTVMAEYDVPGNLTPVEMGMLMKNGTFENTFITAEIVWLATHGVITITEVENKILFFTSKDYELAKTGSAEAEAAMNATQREILNDLFDAGTDTVRLSSLKNSFYKHLPAITKAGNEGLKDKGLTEARGLLARNILVPLGIFLIFVSIVSVGASGFLGLSLGLSAIILIIFGAIMPKRTKEGAELNWQIKGFRLFLETVDKDRAVYYEKENLFEKGLPYAILFGMTKQWIKRMRDIYGEEYFATHPMLWYVAGSGSFNADSFTSAMDGLSSSIAASTSSPSGSGGSGGSGSGGGGGGGGGW
ncbi:MAG: DUF2207 domain-containing protein [Candidatus Moranbacteria bacterium]|nr:DUF2207 domain-containing protein [Candidatus Moranbacteria bacterium]